MEFLKSFRDSEIKNGTQTATQENDGAISEISDWNAVELEFANMKLEDKY